LTLFGLISHWPSYDPPMTFKKNFGDKIWKFRRLNFENLFLFPVEGDHKSCENMKFYQKCHFSNQFRIFEFCLFFSQVIFRTFVQHFFSDLFHNLFFTIFFSIFKFLKISKDFLYIFVIFSKMGFIWCRATHPFWTLAMESAKKGFAKSKMDNTMYCKCPKVILTLTVLFRN